MNVSMAEMADEIRFDIGATDEHPDEIARRIANDLRIEFPNSTARGRQRAACKAAGAEPPPTKAEMEAMMREARLQEEAEAFEAERPARIRRMALSVSLRIALLILMFAIGLLMISQGWTLPGAWEGIF